jgi:hypothetical protein
LRTAAALAAAVARAADRRSIATSLVGASSRTDERSSDRMANLPSRSSMVEPSAGSLAMAGIAARFFSASSRVLADPNGDAPSEVVT